MNKNKIILKNRRLCKEKKIIIPTFSQLKNPETIPTDIKRKLKKVSPKDTHPLNLFRINWKNDIKTGLFGNVNFIEIPQNLSGVKSKIIGLVGKHFPTGSHKAGAAFGCLVPSLVDGSFDPSIQKALWPSTGNYCRGGAYVSALLGCNAIAVLPEEMSSERFKWLEKIGAEIIKTPGSESNVKEIYDKCKEMKTKFASIKIFNQFEQFGNSFWHYHITGNAVEEIFKGFNSSRLRPAGFVSATGSAGTIAAGDYLKTIYPQIKIMAAESLQCPTMFSNGFGSHRIEGIGDKHIPWIHNVKNTDAVCAVDDNACVNLFRLFNEKTGKAVLSKNGIKAETVRNLEFLGISGICNLISAVKFAKYYETDENDVIFTVFTDSADMYLSRLEEMNKKCGKYTMLQAEKDFYRYLSGITSDYIKELNYQDRKSLHNLKYFTWVEQQGKSVEELNELWKPEFWNRKFKPYKDLDKQIINFNKPLY